MSKIYTSKAISYEIISEVGGVKFTKRQIDVAACLIGRQKRKVICKILCISLSTLIEHLQKIKLTIQQYKSYKNLDILEFFETSIEYQHLKNHYIKLLIQHMFEKILCNMSKQLRMSGQYIIEYHNNINTRSLLNKKILHHLNISGVSYSIKISQDASPRENTIYIVPESISNEINLTEQQNSNAILILQSSKDIGYLYYDSVFDLLKIIYGKSKVIPFQNEFKEKKHAYEINLINNSIYLAEPYNLQDKIVNENVRRKNAIIQDNTLSRTLDIFSGKYGVKSSISYILLISFCSYLAISKITILINGELSYLKDNKDIHKIIYSLPARNMKFVDRENTFNIISNNLNKSTIGMITQVIVGTGGIGKTQLAVEYAYRAIEEGKYDAVLWINAESNMSLNNSYANFADKLHLDTRDLHLSEIRNSVHNTILARHDIKKVLFILDNVPSRRNIKNYLLELHEKWPIYKAPHVLITSRSQHWIEETLLLDILSSKEAHAVVKQYLPHEKDHFVSELIRELHNFPLALIQAVGYIKQHTNISHYLNLYSSKKEEYLDILPIYDGQYRQTLWQTISITLDELSDSAKEILYLSSYLAADKIYLDLFNDFSIEDRADAVKELRNHSLIMLTRHREAFRVHRLLQEIIRIKLQDDPYWLNKVVSMAEKVIINFDISKQDPMDITKKWLYQISVLKDYMNKDLNTVNLLNSYAKVAVSLGFKKLSNELYAYSMQISSGSIVSKPKIGLYNSLSDYDVIREISDNYRGYLL